MEKKLLELAVEIVHAQASMSKMTGEDIEQALVRVYNALQNMRLAEEEGRSILVGDQVFQASEAPARSRCPLLHSGRQSYLHGVQG